MKKIWRSMSATLCLSSACLVGGLCVTPPVGAVEMEEQVVLADDLTQNILKVKEQLNINDEFWNDFTYDSYDYGSGLNWNLNWSNKEDARYRLMVTTNADGYLTHYTYRSPESQSGWAKIRRAAAEEKATEFLQKMAVGYADTMRLEEEQSAYQNNSYFTFVYQQYHQDIPVVDGTVTINIDRQNGAVRNCTVGSGINFTDSAWADQSKVISAATAEKALVKELGVELEYRSYYDNEAKKHEIYPVYHLTKGNLVLDANTGKGIERNTGIAEEVMKESMVFNSSNMMTEEAGGLSPEELAAVEQAANLLTQEQAADIMRKGAKTRGYGHLNSSRLSTLYDNEEQYIWSVNLQQDEPRMHLNGALEADSGRILNFYQYWAEREEGKIYSKKEADAAVREFLAEQAANEVKQSILEETENGDEKHPNYNYTYIRQVNGVPFRDNGINVNYDGKGGYISNYRLTWWEDAEFPAVTEVKTPQEIAADMVIEADFVLQYQKTKTGYRLIYDFRDFSAMQFNPFTGQRVNWQGKEYQEEVMPIYHWLGNNNEDAVWLHENGVYLDKEELNNAAAVTQEELAQLLYRSLHPYQATENMYEDLAQKGIINAYEQRPSTYVTRQQAAQYAVRMLGYGDLLAYPELFSYNYDDNCDANYRGAVAISGTLGLLEPDAENNFRAEQLLTQEEAFALIAQSVKKL